MRDGRAKRRIEITAFVTNRQLQQATLKTRHNALNLMNEFIQFFGRIQILIVINSAEAQEQRRSRAQFCQKFSLPGLEQAIYRRY